VGCRLPDAILHGKRSIRPRSRAVRRLAVAGFRVRPLSSLGLVVAPPARKPGQDTSMTLVPRLDPLARGRPPLLAVRWPRATGLASYLSGCLWLIGQRFLFLNRRRLGRVWASPASARIPSRFERSLCSAFRRLSLGGPARGAARVVRPCWWAVATACPEGNCHSPRPETSLDYLTRLRAASHRSWPPNSCFAGTGDARTSP
jgi:hypothetical protein